MDHDTREPVHGQNKQAFGQIKSACVSVQSLQNSCCQHEASMDTKPYIKGS